jgi:hypothetical protein
VLGIVPISEFLYKYLQKSTKNGNLCQPHANTSPIGASVQTHKATSDDSWPSVLGIVPVS